jgi:hypothetical protein
MKEATGSLTSGLYLLAAVLCTGGLVLLAIVPRARASTAILQTESEGSLVGGVKTADH